MEITCPNCREVTARVVPGENIPRRVNTCGSAEVIAGWWTITCCHCGFQSRWQEVAALYETIIHCE